MPPFDTHNIATQAATISASADAVAKLKESMADAEFVKKLSVDPKVTLNGVGIDVDSITADAIKNQLSGGKGLNPNAIIQVTAIA
jgi:hypothetical protein